MRKIRKTGGKVIVPSDASVAQGKGPSKGGRGRSGKSKRASQGPAAPTGQGGTTEVIGFNDTIDLANVFKDELTESGSFDVRTEIWATTFGKVIQALPIPVAVVDRSHKMWAVNEAWGRLEIDCRRLQSIPFTNLVKDPAGKERIDRLLQDIFIGRRPRVTEGMLQLERGRRWVRMTLRAIKIKGERFVLLVLEDLTAEKVQLKDNMRLRGELERRVEERTAELQLINEEVKREVLSHRRTLEALEASESRYREVVEDQTDMIYRFAPHGAMSFINPACADFLGASVKGVVDRNVFDIIPLDYGLKLKHILKNLDIDERAGEFEHLFRDAQGRNRWTSWAVRAIVDDQGSMTAIQCVGRDITERKAAAEALRESEELLRAIFESSRDMILVKDRDLKITHWNPAAENLLGLEASQLLGRRAEDIFDPETAAHIKELDKRVLAGEVVELETTRTILGGSITFLEVASPIMSPQGDVIGVCAISRDITSRKDLGSPRMANDQKYPSVSMKAAMEQTLMAANTDSTVLLGGETGVGKDYFARWIHDHSSRAGFSYHAINCATLPPYLAESELFGHERGAFTGAVSRKRGLLEISEGGTLLLNEIGELPLSLQAKLLTFLDTRSFLRVGGDTDIHVNTRLMAATHRDLKQEIADGRFLESLYYRLNVLRIYIPPLRDRLDDLPILVQRLYEELTSKIFPSHAPQIEMTSIRSLLNYHWPGNVRELRNVLERALMMAQGNRVVLRPPEDETASKDVSFNVALMQGETLSSATEKLTRLMCEEALRQAAGNKAHAAKNLGLSRGAMYRILRRLEIE